MSTSPPLDPPSSSPTPFPPSLLPSLFKAAISAKSQSYSPYSTFRVGCAILTSSLTIVTGANVENASYPVGMCAEMCAGGKAVTEGHLKFLAVAVATDSGKIASPCGMCRQFLREFSPLTMPIYMLDRDGNVMEKTLDELLPMSFGPEDLKG